MAIPGWVKWSQTALILLIIFNAGFNLGILSPALPDLQHLTNSTTAQISTLFIWVGLATVLGAVILGPLYDRYNWCLLMAATMLLQGVFIGLTPMCPNLAGLSVIFSMGLAFNMAILTGVFAITMKIWWNEPNMSSSIVQAADLMHALGTALVPQAIAPFLGDFREHMSTISPINMTTVAYEKDANDGVLTTMAGSNATESSGEIKYAFWALAVFDLLVAVFCFMAYFLYRHPHSLQKTSSEVSDRVTSSSTGQEEESAMTVTPLLVCFLAVVMFLSWVNGGRDVLMSGLLYTYVNQFLYWEIKEGTALVTVYHVVRVVIHVIVVPISHCVHPMHLLIFDLVVLLAAPLVMIFTVELSKTSVWVCVTLIAFGTSNINPTTFSLVQVAIPVSGKIMGLLIGCMSFALCTFSPITGVLLQHGGVVTFPAILVGISCAGILLLLPLYFMARMLQTRRDGSLYKKLDLDNDSSNTSQTSNAEVDTTYLCQSYEETTPLIDEN